MGLIYGMQGSSFLEMLHQSLFKSPNFLENINIMDINGKSKDYKDLIWNIYDIDTNSDLERIFKDKTFGGFEKQLYKPTQYTPELINLFPRSNE